ncbi:MAG: WYL domain-containing protein [Clostridia bacterium]|nr:WYL domain-containing protein [Clostridia bacterium]
MYTVQPKKMLIINILDILKKYTDENHRLSQKEILQILENDYHMKADRKAVKRNLSNLIDLYDENSPETIQYSQTIRMVPVKDTATGECTEEMEESSILSDFYLERAFSDAELRLLIDSLLFSKHIPYKQCKELIEKIEALSNQYFKSKVKHILNLPSNLPQNKQLFFNIEILDEAISTHKQVQFVYNEYDTDKCMHPRKTVSGEVRQYIVNPYQMVATNGRYYLICNYDKYDNVVNYRVDKITDIKLLDTPAKMMRNVKGLENGLDLPKHMAEHIYMFAGESGRVTFRTKRYLITELIDWFGTDIQFLNEADDQVTVSVTVNYNAMRHWAMQYARHIKLLSPKHLVDSVKADLQEAAENYEDL